MSTSLILGSWKIFYQRRIKTNLNVQRGLHIPKTFWFLASVLYQLSNREINGEPTHHLVHMWQASSILVIDSFPVVSKRCAPKWGREGSWEGNGGEDVVFLSRFLPTHRAPCPHPAQVAAPLWRRLIEIRNQFATVAQRKLYARK